ncbi:LAGLIDADG family homing endonuclease [Candidatus Uhrbacteria bacterium]|nr:LAGLIDADG family homing endonuclease [Candidatus Uhrbacteria bacterium]
MSLNPNYVTGLAEWAGSFTYSRGKGGLTLYFGIRCTNKDLTLLLKIRDFFGAGKVYKGGHGLKKWVYFRVNKLGELIKIAKHFEEYPLQGPKQHIFAVWQNMVICKRRKLPKDRERILDLAQKLSKLNTA